MILSIIKSLQAAKLQTGVRAKYGKDNGKIRNNCADDNSGSNRMNYENDSSGGLVPLNGYQDVVNGADKEQNLQKCSSSLALKRADTTACASRASTVSKDYSGKPFSGEWCEFFDSPIPHIHCYDYIVYLITRNWNQRLRLW